MNWKRELINAYNENCGGSYECSSNCPYIYRDCGDVSGFDDINKDEFARYVELFDSERSYGYYDDGFVDCPTTLANLVHIFVINRLCLEAPRSNKIKLDLFVGYVKNMFAKLLILCNRKNFTMKMTCRVISRQYAECLICYYKDYVDCNKIFVCCDCVMIRSGCSDEVGIHFWKHKSNPCKVCYTGFGTVNLQNVVDNAHKLIGRCKYVDCDSIVLFVMARDELGLLVDVVKVVVGLVYC